MNILVLNYEYPPLGGGAASVCRDLSEEIGRAGHRVTVVTMGFPGLPDYERSGGVEVYRLKCLRKKQFSCMPWEQYTYIAAAKKFLRRHLESSTYDICHTHFVIPTGPLSLWLHRRYGVPCVITAHGSDVEGYNRKRWMQAAHVALRPFWRKIVREANISVAPSPYLMRLMKRAMKGGQLLLIPNGLSFEKYHTDPDNKTDGILLMGRMQKSKNFQTAILAFAMIPENVWNNWHVDILGDGPCRRDLEQLADKLGIGERISFHGWVDHESQDHLDYLRRSSIFLSASHFENCPMGVLEAVASGCYPILSDIEGHRQLFAEDEDRYFFTPDDAEGLAARLEETMRQNPAERLCALDNKKFELKETAGRYLDLFQSILN